MAAEFAVLQFLHEFLYHGAERLARRTSLDRARQFRAGLLHNADIGAALADLERVIAGINRAGGRENGDRAAAFFLRRVMPADARRRFDGRHHDADCVSFDAVLFHAHGQPLLLYPAQRHDRRRIAGDNHQRRPLRKQRLQPRAGQRQDFNRRARAIGRVFVVAQIDEILLRQCINQRAVNGEATKATVKNADHVKFPFMGIV